MFGMRLTVISILACMLGVCGCSRESGGTPNSASERASDPKKLIVGSWATSTSAEMSSMAWKLKFLESGEYHISGPMLINGAPVIIENNGKKENAAITGSGSWQLDGDELRTELSITNVSNLESETTISKVLELSEHKLSLEEKGETRVYFRLKE